MNKRIFVERKSGFQIEANDLKKDLTDNLGIKLQSLRYFIVYDLFHTESIDINKSIDAVFIEKNRDVVYTNLPQANHIITYESLPGQFDQRASSAEECLRVINEHSEVVVRSGVVITCLENLTETQIERIKSYLINRVESREKDLLKLEMPHVNPPSSIPIIDGFITMNEMELNAFYEEFSFAMNLSDLAFIQQYFRSEKRNPTETELRVLDTYWSDHCRHTTFETIIKKVLFESNDLISSRIQSSHDEYLNMRSDLKREHKPMTLMDLATINAKREYKYGNLNDLEISDEINAASIYIKVDVNNREEEWLLMFKNETHNHPTEIEPFGGASTCIGGAIRDPLSGRSYVYQAMRVTGAADITTSYDKTMEGKLPQQTISKQAAHGYSSYGNQIGLATTFVEELHHPGYLAKRMEIGAVIGAVKKSNIRREKPQKGDVILLLGGRTGRDGIGGATGSSKEHTILSIEQSSAEVQKGNAPEERKIQRLFRNPLVSKLIKKSNDFGAGGVSVAIGELADGLIIDLNAVPTKYEGINGTELAISESQERMAVVISKEDVETFTSYCHEENIEVSQVAQVTDSKRLVMMWNNQTICDIKRSFIDTSGVRQEVEVHVPTVTTDTLFNRDYNGDILIDKISCLLQDDNVSSKQGMEEMFDSSIGRTTVLSPYGGRYRLTKSQVSIQQIPTRQPGTNTVSIMGYGFDPYLSEKSPYHGSMYAILHSMAKVVASGAQYQSIRFTFQEYYQKLHDNPHLWAKPYQALLGAFETLKQFHLAAIGGKDSMSGTYHDLFVPPTFVSFAVCTADKRYVVSNEWKEAGSKLYLYSYKKDSIAIPDFAAIKTNYKKIHNLIHSKDVKSAYAIGYGGIVEAVFKASMGNKIGANIITELDVFEPLYGAILIETNKTISEPNVMFIGVTTTSNDITINGESITIDDAITLNQKKYLSIYPIYHDEQHINTYPTLPIKRQTYHYPNPTKNVKVLIPVFPGTNCEYDSEDAFIAAGATTKIIVFNNQTQADIEKSITIFEEEIKTSHIIMFSGGFSSGDEPDGSGKYIASILRHERIAKAITKHLSKKRLILGICNGFQALLKAGLLPYGSIHPITEDAPTLFKNKLNRHVAKFINTSVSSLSSPWLESFDQEEVHSIPVSHGEGRFIISDEEYKELTKHHQIAFQYVNDANQPTNDPSYNPNGSSYAIEGIISKDGLILGKMGHSERYQEGLFQNITGNKSQNLFQNAVNYINGGNNDGKTI